MPIQIIETIETPLSSVATHEDRFGKGGYRVVSITTVGGAAWGSNNASWGTTDANVQEALNALVPTSRRKVGMLCFDATSSRYFRQSGSATWVETFANDGSIDLANYVQRSELPQAADGSIDIASDAELAEALLNAVQVEADGTTNLTATTAAVPGNTSDALIVGTAIAVPAVNQKATMTITLNTNAIGGDAGAA